MFQNTLYIFGLNFELKAPKAKLLQILTIDKRESYYQKFVNSPLKLYSTYSVFSLLTGEAAVRCQAVVPGAHVHEHCATAHGGLDGLGGLGSWWTRRLDHLM